MHAVRAGKATRRGAACGRHDVDRPSQQTRASQVLARGVLAHAARDRRYRRCRLGWCGPERVSRGVKSSLIVGWCLLRCEKASAELAVRHRTEHHAIAPEP